MSSTAGLKRALGLWDLVFVGIILVQPTAPMPVFGIVAVQAKGHVVTTILIAMAAILFTAISYGRMARAYPSAGSVYTYVGREIHSGAGFLTGWSMATETLMNLLISTIMCAKLTANLIGGVPFAAFAVFYVALFSALNLRGIRATARTNEGLVMAMSMVILWFLAAAVRYLFQHPAPPLTQPFYDPATFSWNNLATGTSVAVLTYIGFEGISTLSEEAHNPRRNILLATVLTCVVTGVLAMIVVYLGQLVWPDFRTFPDPDTAFVDVAGRAGGKTLFHALNLTLLVATVGSGMGAQLATVRLLYGMGRDNTIPRAFFGAIEARRGVPRNNVLFTGALALAGAFTVSFQLGAELLNFCALVAFMGVNAAALARYWWHAPAEEVHWSHVAVPVLGFAVCLAIWLNLRAPAKIAGAVWILVGLGYAAYQSRGFQRPIQFFEPPAE